jgi:membrane protease YdiL (CAAX protease family)
MAQKASRWKTMSLFDDDPLKTTEPNLDSQYSRNDAGAPSAAEPLAAPLGGDPISFAADAPPFRRTYFLPEDLRISWSWPHLIVFLIFGFGSLLLVQLGGIFMLTANRHLSQKQLEQMIEAKPQFLVGTNVLWYALLFLFLYMTLAVLRGLPFWRSLGWKKLSADPIIGKGSPWMYFVSGCGLAIFVAVASSRVKEVDHVPIQDLFKSRTGAMLLMAMAVFVAPLVEETVFRGYLYPLFASKFSGLAQNAGVNPLGAVRFGTFAGILITGILFGLMHGAQLGWTWGLVALLTLVGIIFTFARAWTGTVVASFLLHLGYNSMIAVTSIIATKGFTHMPPVR